MQSDGNLVIYGPNKPRRTVLYNPVWDTKTWGNPGATLEVTFFGAVDVVSKSGAVLWRSSGLQGGPVYQEVPATGPLAGLSRSFKTLGASTRGTSLAVPVRVAHGANRITHKGVSAKNLAKPAAGTHTTTAVSRGAPAQRRPASSTLV